MIVAPLGSKHFVNSSPDNACAAYVRNVTPSANTETGAPAVDEWASSVDSLALAVPVAEDERTVLRDALNMALIGVRPRETLSPDALWLIAVSDRGM